MGALAASLKRDYYPGVAVAGELAGEKGRRGVYRAKTWLQRSTRVEQIWTVYDQTPSVDLLTFICPGTERGASFDIGGVFRGEELEKRSFLAEVKDYGPRSDQYPQFKKFLALCYMAYTLKPEYCDRLIWITWRPFGCDKWDDLTSMREIIEAVVSDRKRVFGSEVTPEEASSRIDLDTAAAIAERLWLIVLSEGHESLGLRRIHLAEIVKLIALEAEPS